VHAIAPAVRALVVGCAKLLVTVGGLELGDVLPASIEFELNDVQSRGGLPSQEACILNVLTVSINDIRLLPFEFVLEYFRESETPADAPL